MARKPLVRRARSSMAYARRTRRRIAKSPRAQLATGLVCLLTGLLVATSARASQGTDLRPNRNTDLIGYVSTQARKNHDLAAQVSELRSQVDVLSRSSGSSRIDRTKLASVSEQAGLTAVHGPAVTVTLTDAPTRVAPEGVDADLLVVHQQDIQAVVNVLWAGGAEAMTIQGQRVTSLTGVKCVGNTVVLHGVPYAPPYVVSAIGDPAALEAALAASAYLTGYRDYVAAYGLGYSQTREVDVRFPPYTGSLDLAQARPGG